MKTIIIIKALSQTYNILIMDHVVEGLIYDRIIEFQFINLPA